MSMTQQEVADHLNISRARVHQIERRAIRKLRQAMEEAGYVFEDMYEGATKPADKKGAA